MPARGMASVNAHNVADSPAFMATIGQPSLPAYVRDACVLLVRFQFHIQGTLAIEQLDLSGARTDCSAWAAGACSPVPRIGDRFRPRAICYDWWGGCGRTELANVHESGCAHDGRHDSRHGSHARARLGRTARHHTRVDQAPAGALSREGSESLPPSKAHPLFRHESASTRPCSARLKTRMNRHACRFDAPRSNDQ